MKFNRKPETVQIGAMISEPGMIAHGHFAVTEPTGETFSISIDELVRQYEPADDDAKRWLEEMKAKIQQAEQFGYVPNGVAVSRGRRFP